MIKVASLRQAIHQADGSSPKRAAATNALAGRGGSWRVALFGLSICLLIWFLRRPEQLFHPYLWDEESLVVRRFIEDGWLGGLRPVQGYMILPATILLPLATTLSFAHLPMLAFWMATAVFAMTVWMLVAPDSRWGNQHTRVLMALAMALCPANPETFGVLLYSFWWATLWPVIILGWTRDVWWARVPLLVISGLSSPAGPAMAVPFAMSWWFSRRRADMVAAGVLTVALGLQLTSLMAGGRQGTAVSMNPLLVLVQSLRTIGLFVTWMIPVHGAWQVSSLVGGIAAAAAVYVLRLRPAVEPLLLFVAGVLFIALSAVPAPLATHPRVAGPRYYFLPFVLLSWLLVYLWRESGLRSPIPLVAGILLGISMLGIVTTFSRSPASTTGRLDWGQEIAGCAASNARLVTIPIYYDGSAGSLWRMSMTPAECRARL